MELVTPDMYVSSLGDIDLDELNEQGIKGIICDLDNTLVPFGSEKIRESTEVWLREIRARGVSMVIVSNALSERVNRLSEKLGLEAIPGATKPRAHGYLRALEMMNLAAEECAVVGDQLFTDIVGGNRLGMCTILVVPLSQQDFFMTRFVRFMERLMLQYLQRRGLTEGPE